MRNRYVLLADVVLIVLAAIGAFWLRFEWRFYVFRPEFVLFVETALVVKLLTFYVFGLYRRYWRYASVAELWVVVLGVTTASVTMALVVALVLTMHPPLLGFSRAILGIDWLLTLVFVGGLRMSIRMAAEVGRRQTGSKSSTRKILVVGAGDAGAMVVREMYPEPPARYAANWVSR